MEVCRIMKTVCDIDKCAGCMACVDICPKGAISILDSLKSYNAVIDTDKCVGCNMCHKVCQKNQNGSFLKPILWKQGWASDETIRKYSSSGGAATVLAKQFVKDGGIVCSCVFNNGCFVFDFAETVEQVNKFSGSRYIKSDPTGAYKKAKQILRSNKKLLFIGLPCQVSSMKNYTGNPDNLYTIDLICHGTPSPKILDIYLKQSDIDIKSMNNLYFRNGMQYHLTDRKDDGFHAVFDKNVIDAYLMSFLNTLCCTENCYSCQYAKLERISDITLGDSWGSDLDSKEQKKGISLILCQTKKGVDLLHQCDMKLFDVDLEQAVSHNHQLSDPSLKPVQRERFFEQFEHGYKFDKIVKRIYPKQSFKQVIKKIMLKLKLLK